MTRHKAHDTAQGSIDARDRRAERLAAALKANLKRRKAQARGRATAEVEPTQPDPAPDEQGR